MRYFVVQTLTVDHGDEDEGVGPDVDVRLVPCEDTRAVLRAIAEVRDADGGDWRVFEMVGGRALSRAVVFKYDGRACYDVEVQ